MLYVCTLLLQYGKLLQVIQIKTGWVVGYLPVGVLKHGVANLIGVVTSPS